MNDFLPPRPSRRWSVAPQACLVLALSLAIAACGKDEKPAVEGAAPTTAAAPAVTPETAVSTKVAAMSVEQLREAASKAYTENRLYAPAEDNAVEYYLALRDKLPGDAAVSSALIDLLPMTVIAIEQGVNREDFAEAQRLAALLEKADKTHPALPRLKDSIAARQAESAKRTEQQVLTAAEQAKAQTELEKKRLEDQKKQQEQAKQLAQQQSADRAAAQKREAEQRAADQRAADQRAAEQRAADQRAAQRIAAAVPAADAGDLRPLSTPGPAFPPDALRAGQSGEVQVEFTVGTDGTVTAARVVRANPARVFDRAAINAVRKWRFQPVGSPVTTRRTIGFNAAQ